MKKCAVIIVLSSLGLLPIWSGFAERHPAEVICHYHFNGKPLKSECSVTRQVEELVETGRKFCIAGYMTADNSKELEQLLAKLNAKKTILAVKKNFKNANTENKHFQITKDAAESATQGNVNQLNNIYAIEAQLKNKKDELFSLRKKYEALFDSYKDQVSALQRQPKAAMSRKAQLPKKTKEHCAFTDIKPGENRVKRLHSEIESMMYILSEAHMNLQLRAKQNVQGFQENMHLAVAASELNTKMNSAGDASGTFSASGSQISGILQKPISAIAPRALPLPVISNFDGVSEGSAPELGAAANAAASILGNNSTASVVSSSSSGAGLIVSPEAQKNAFRKYVNEFGASDLNAKQKDQLVTSVIDICKIRDCDPAYMLAKMGQESGFNTKVVSHAGARGISQFMPSTAEEEARRIGETYDVNNIEQQVRLMVNYHKRLEQRSGSSYGGSVAYNAGPNRADRYSLSEPLNYSKKIADDRCRMLNCKTEILYPYLSSSRF